MEDFFQKWLSLWLFVLTVDENTGGT